MADKIFPLGLTAVMLPELDIDDQLALCKELKLTHYSVRPRVIPEDQRAAAPSNWGRHMFDLTPARLVKEGQQLARKFADAGIVPFGTAPSATVGDSDEAIHEHCQGAAAVGAGRVRVAPAGLSRDDSVLDYPKLLAEAIKGYQRVVKIAKGYGQKVVIETHCLSIATSPALALNICREFDAKELGVIFDIANFNIEGAIQPRLAVAVLGDYIDHVHIGGCRWYASGTDAQGVTIPERRMSSMTESHLYLPAWVEALHKAGRHVPLLIEDYTPGMAGPCRLRRSAGDLHRMVDAL